MIGHQVRACPAAARLAREEQLAWRLAAVATDPVEVTAEVTEMVINRVIDDDAAAAAALARPAVQAAREQALRHPAVPGQSGPGAAVWGAAASVRTSPEWAAWANGVAVRELDFHDTFLAAEYSHPGDNIPPVLAVAQHTGRRGADLVRGIAAAYEVQVSGDWHHVRSYAPERASRPDTLALWRNISTAEDPDWTRRYHHTDPAKWAFGGRAEITLANGTVISDELAVADARPAGARPFGRAQYIAKFRALADGVIAPGAQQAFLDAETRLPELDADQLAGLTLPGITEATQPTRTWGIL